ncbi:MAG: LysM peptidoglycan-binding domain-containing protein [Salibacteraceae bacterium]
MTVKNVLLGLATLFVVPSLQAQETTAIDSMVTDSLTADSAEVVWTMAPDDPVVAALDSLLTHAWFQSPATDSLAPHPMGFAADSIPEYADSVLAQRLAELNEETPFNLVYNNSVRGFIRLYANRRRNLTARMMGLSEQYFPMFEETLDRYNLPLEFKYLAMVESALNPVARSRSGAVGLWQFMYGTGRMYGLGVTSYYDERQDPYLSTEAACQYFEFLYGMYGNWDLVLAAYNCGPGNVNRAIRRSGGKRNYWDLWPYLPRETRGYVPAFIAVNYVMAYATEHNIRPIAPQVTYAAVDTVQVTDRISFALLSEKLDISKEELELLNPAYRRGVLPKSKTTRTLVLPREKIGLFVTNADSLYQQEKKQYASTAGSSAPSAPSETRQTHIVRRGEYLGAIANRYNCSVSNLKAWNGLRSTRIKPGQRLIVYTPEKKRKKAPAKAASTITAQKTTEGNYVYYRIQKGDTLWDISRKEGISVKDLQRLNRNLNSRNLKPGTRIIVGVGS